MEQWEKIKLYLSKMGRWQTIAFYTIAGGTINFLYFLLAGGFASGAGFTAALFSPFSLIIGAVVGNSNYKNRSK